MTAKDFLKLHGQCADNVDVDKSIALFHNQMQLGLKGDGGLPMIPTYLSNVERSKIRQNSKRILIDAGGTNFRSAIGYFDEKGNPIVENLSKTVMPASDRLLTKNEFYGAIAANIKRLLNDGKDIGFCFSYQVDMDADVDGTVVMFSKEMQAPEVIGTRVGQETLKACKRYSNTERKIVVLNDTVATLLGGMAIANKQYSGYLGYIYGTGTNVCYVEDTANITKIAGLPSGQMLINTECGNFTGFTQGTFDKIAIAKTALPDKQIFEKMTSGKYLSEIMYQALLAAKSQGEFVGKLTIKPFELKDVSDFLTNGKFPCKFEQPSDVAFAKDVCALLIERAAKMGAIVNASLAIASCKDKSLPVAVVCEGTTFNKLPYYRKHFESYLKQILTPHGISYEILQGDELNLVGTLMATMIL